MYRKTILAAWSAALAVWAGAVGAVPPATFTYGGFLTTDAGAPVTVATDLTFRFYDAAVGGSQVGTADVVTVTPNSDGYFTAVVGAGIAGFPNLFETAVWMTVQVEGDAAEMTPRIPITSVPSALAVQWGGVTNVPAPCAAGQYLRGYDAVGNAVCAGDANSGGTVTSITAGSGLSGGTITGTGTLSLNTAAANTWTANQTFSGQVIVGLEMVVSTTVQISSNNGTCANYGNATCYYGSATATCPTGKRTLGGGCGVFGTIARHNVESSYPTASSWVCYANGSETGSQLRAYALCARLQ
jgi:hypothetical protein